MGLQLTIGAALLAVGAAQQPASPSARQSAQQLFDAAAAHEAKKDWAGAAAAWERLERAAGNNKRTRAIAGVRKGNALYNLDQDDAAVAALRSSLAGLPTGDPTLREDRYQAHLILGRVAERSLDYATAAKEYAAAETLGDAPSLKLGAMVRLAATQTFLDPVAAAATLDRADAIMAPIQVAPETKAVFARRRAILQLNRGDFAGARDHATRAVRLLGGLTTRVNLEDVAARGDAALAFLLGGQAEKAREYMAYTGAGRVPGGFGPGAEMKPPPCGGEAGLKPTDVAVIEFSIGDRGEVTLATPIYAAGGPSVALEFARVAREWSWSPEGVKKLPAFFRNNARVEMRCSTAFERPSVGDLLEADLGAWLTTKDASMPDEDGAAAALAERDRATYAAAQARGGTDVALIGPAYRLVYNRVVPREESHDAARRALAAAVANGAPPTARLALELAVRGTEGAQTWHGVRWRNRLHETLADPVYAADPRARAVTRLMLADAEGGDDARPHLTAVADDAALAAADPLKVGALIRLASLEHAEGRPDAARAAFARSGLAADQCALVDKTPDMLSSGAGSDDFPMEAARWGFEGWVSTEYDIAANGRTQGVRAVLSYPPFVFSPAGEGVFRSARFEKTFRPDGGLGCGAQGGRVRFEMPGG
ncbi:hypothetical protein [Sphingomonas lenta]|uniref:TonB C-terminal domain-containing protein n=1 Tax=Sphingomonas lenta TaxID=1141887 RepID=A0A2A2SK84_9SPHN|nr:hypothetical protein [Sphingomonas lenta]PAX09628.1 hypothetical protein CKY28_02500 [Sphingomonas lenta]